MRSPYENLPPEAFWRTGVAEQSADAIPFLYRPKFPIDRTLKIATAGSCFAQHLGRHLRARGFSVIDMEAAPAILSREQAARFGYGVYSARYGNIYTARQLKQLILEATGELSPCNAVWEKDGRFYDALRPAVEPNGLSSPEVVADHRSYHLTRALWAFRKAGILVFTLGLTEAWEHVASGTIYPTAPGTIAGQYDPSEYKLKNFTFAEIYEDLSEFWSVIKKLNPKLRWLLTVSPVPMTATASGQHVLCANTYSKSVLRAVAGQLCQEHADIDYFPGYEIVTGPLARGQFYNDNLRTVSSEGLEAVMKACFAALDPAAHQPDRTGEFASSEKDAAPVDEDVACEEELLDAFAR